MGSRSYDKLCIFVSFKVCPSLSFLDNFVAKALRAGALTYQQNFSNNQETSETKKGSLSGVEI
jgi:hypothetical protein